MLRLRRTSSTPWRPAVSSALQRIHDADLSRGARTKRSAGEPPSMPHGRTGRCLRHGRLSALRAVRRPGMGRRARLGGIWDDSAVLRARPAAAAPDPRARGVSLMVDFGKRIGLGIAAAAEARAGWSPDDTGGWLTDWRVPGGVKLDGTRA